MAQKNMTICRDGDCLELEIPAPGGIIQVRLELATAFTLFRLLDTCIESDPELTQLYARCLGQWKRAAAKSG